MLDARLACVAARVRPGSRVADIGTDHAHLPVWLVGQGVCPGGIASDLRAGPAEAARRTVERAGLADSIAVRVGDGLSPVSPEEADDMVIAGMGGETIAAILAAAPWLKDAAYRLVLQPMTHPELLREYLLTNGFSIEGEWIAAEGKRRYLILQAAYTGAPPVTDEAAYYTGALPPGAEGAAFLRGQARHLRRRAAGLQSRDPQDGEAARLLALADRLDAYGRREEER